MTKITAHHRLNGLEPDNLLAFMALLGLLQTLEKARPDWFPRVSWMVNDPAPLRPCLHVAEENTADAIIVAVSEGLSALAKYHYFYDLKNLMLRPNEVEGKLQEAACSDRYAADLWAALVSDAAVADDGHVERTPLCLMFGQGHQHFLSRLASVPQKKCPPDRGTGRKKSEISEMECLHEALFKPWQRPDDTPSFRWDPNEDVRYALRARDPTNAKTKETTQHGANRLAAVGLSVFTVVPRRRYAKVQLALLGGGREHGRHTVNWPIWREPTSLAGIRALLNHPYINQPGTREGLGVVECRSAQRISSGKFMNFTRAKAKIE